MKKYRIFLIISLIFILGVLVFYNREVLFEKKGTKQISPIDLKMDTVEDSLPAVSSDGESDRLVCPSGEPVGIYVKTKGVLVIGTSEVKTENGSVSSPCEDILHPGDYIMRMNEEALNDKTTMMRIIKESGGKELLLRVCRDNQYFNIKITPVKTKDGSYAIGLWVKDDISGIGTITYTEGDKFAALGHSINDNDTGIMFRVSDGAIYDTTIVRIKKPEEQTPGRLEGVINYSGHHVIGRVEENSAYGIHGYLTKRKQQTEEEKKRVLVPVGDCDSVHVGTAYLMSSVSGQSKQYEIEIISVDSDNENGKCMEFTVKDSELLALTGGIVQGMSGTPILQDGKLIGAVTHVFVNDSTRGYGIFIENMME